MTRGIEITGTITGTITLSKMDDTGMIFTGVRIKETAITMNQAFTVVREKITVTVTITMMIPTVTTTTHMVTMHVLRCITASAHVKGTITEKNSGTTHRTASWARPDQDTSLHLPHTDLPPNRPTLMP